MHSPVATSKIWIVESVEAATMQFPSGQKDASFHPLDQRQLPVAASHKRMESSEQEIVYFPLWPNFSYSSCMENDFMHFPVYASQRRRVPSAELEKICFPSGLKSREKIFPECPFNTADRHCVACRKAYSASGV